MRVGFRVLVTLSMTTEDTDGSLTLTLMGSLADGRSTALVFVGWPCFWTSGSLDGTSLMSELVAGALREEALNQTDPRPMVVDLGGTLQTDFLKVKTFQHQVYSCLLLPAT